MTALQTQLVYHIKRKQYLANTQLPKTIKVRNKEKTKGNRFKEVLLWQKTIQSTLEENQ